MPLYHKGTFMTGTYWDLLKKYRISQISQISFTNSAFCFSFWRVQAYLFLLGFFWDSRKRQSFIRCFIFMNMSGQQRTHLHLDESWSNSAHRTPINTILSANCTSCIFFPHFQISISVTDGVLIPAFVNKVFLAISFSLLLMSSLSISTHMSLQFIYSCVYICVMCGLGTDGPILLGCWSVTVSLPSIKQVINWDGSI